MMTEPPVDDYRSIASATPLGQLAMFVHDLLLRVVRPFARLARWVSLRTFVIEGSAGQLQMGARCSPMNTIFNLASGNITVGDDVIFGHNCMVLTGRHNFVDGQRASMKGLAEVPRSGFDIVIGTGCWIASGAILTGGIELGSNCIVAAGAVVTKSFPSNSVIGGVPASALKGHRGDKQPRSPKS